MQIVHYIDDKLPCVAFVQSSYDVQQQQQQQQTGYDWNG